MSIRIDEPVTSQTVTVADATGSYRQVVLLIPESEAQALASAPRNANGDMYADDSKPVAKAISDALIAAGLGGE